MNESSVSNFSKILFVLLFATGNVVLICNTLEPAKTNMQSGRVAASTSLSAIVPATPTNTLYAELQQKQKELEKKEQALTAQETQLRSRTQPSSFTMRSLYALLAALLVLTSFNVYLDFRRNQNQNV